MKAAKTSLRTKLLIAAGLAYLMLALIGASGWYYLSSTKNFVESTQTRVATVLAERKGEAAAAQAREHQQGVDGVRAGYRQAQWLVSGLVIGTLLFALLLMYYRAQVERSAKRLAKMYAALNNSIEAILRAKSPQDLFQGVCD